MGQGEGLWHLNSISETAKTFILQIDSYLYFAKYNAIAKIEVSIVPINRKSAVTS